MTKKKASKGKLKNKPKGKDKKKPQPKKMKEKSLFSGLDEVMGQLPTTDHLPEYTYSVYMAGDQKPVEFVWDEETNSPKEKDRPDEIRFVDSCPSCMHPQVYESFNEGRKITASVNGKQHFQLTDNESGLTFKSSHGEELSLDYSTASDLLYSLMIMDSVKNGKIFGLDKHWWVGHNGKVDVLTKLLQNLREERNNKKVVR